MIIYFYIRINKGFVMSKRLGMAALVFAIIGLFISFGYFLSILSGLLCIFNYKNGFIFAISSIIINYVNIMFMFLSPTLSFVTSSNKNQMIEDFLLFQTIALIIFLILYITHKIIIYRNKKII